VNATTIATHVINQGRTLFGTIHAVALPRSTWEEVMEEVTASGGEVGFDYCVVDGVRVRGDLSDDDRRGAIYPAAGDAPAFVDLAG
jgi:hypothetical protein